MTTLRGRFAPQMSPSVSPARSMQDGHGDSRAENADGAAGYAAPTEWAWEELNLRPHAYQSLPTKAASERDESGATTYARLHGGERSPKISQNRRFRVPSLSPEESDTRAPAVVPASTPVSGPACDVPRRIVRPTGLLCPPPRRGGVSRQQQGRTLLRLVGAGALAAVVGCTSQAEAAPLPAVSAVSIGAQARVLGTCPGGLALTLAGDPSSIACVLRADLAARAARGGAAR